jgi:hypothetical protein
MSDEANLNPNLEPDQVSADFEPDRVDVEPSDEPMFDSLTGQAIVQPVAPQINLAVLEERVVVRVGYASATGSFRELPKLRGATDTEVADAAKLGELVVEWIE